MKRSRALWPLALLLFLSRGTQADRIVLAPAGATLNPEGFKVEGLLSPCRQNENLVWLQYSSPRQIELEYNRSGLRKDKVRHALNVQYPLLTDLGTYPAISVGIRDILATGLERQSVYLAISKAIPLSDRQYRLIKDLHFNAGAGTGYIGGGFFGVQMKLHNGIGLDADFYRRRPNLSLHFDLVRNLQAKAYSLDGEIYYGLAFTLAR